MPWYSLVRWFQAMGAGQVRGSLLLSEQQWMNPLHCITCRQLAQEDKYNFWRCGERCQAGLGISTTLNQADLNRLDQMAEDNCGRFNKAKCQVLHLDHNNPMWHYGLEKDALRDLGVLPDRQQDMSQGGQESQRNLGLSKTVWPTGLGSDCPLVLSTGRSQFECYA